MVHHDSKSNLPLTKNIYYFLENFNMMYSPWKPIHVVDLHDFGSGDLFVLLILFCHFADLALLFLTVSLDFEG